MTVGEVLFYFTRVWYLPRRDCPASRIWNNMELDVQNKTQAKAIPVIKTAFQGPDDLTSVVEVLFYITYVWYLPRRDSSVHYLEPQGTWCAKLN